jgi:hypothetical protein
MRPGVLDAGDPPCAITALDDLNPAMIASASWMRPLVRNTRVLRTVAFDGLNSVHVPDSDRNRSWLGKLRNRLGLAGYPAMRIVALAETGTRGLLGAVIGGIGERAEVPLARKLVTLLREGMLLLAGCAYDAADLLAAIAAAGAHFLVRGSASRRPGVGEILPDGSYLSPVDGLAACQALRMAMTAAAESAGTDPDRASFTAALEAARDQVTAARRVADSADPGDTGRIGRAGRGRYALPGPVGAATDSAGP